MAEHTPTVKHAVLPFRSRRALSVLQWPSLLIPLMLRPFPIGG